MHVVQEGTAQESIFDTKADISFTAIVYMCTQMPSAHVYLPNLLSKLTYL